MVSIAQAQDARRIDLHPLITSPTAMPSLASCKFTDSPAVSSALFSQRPQFAPCSPPSPNRLVFEKVSIPSSSNNSTDSEFQSDHCVSDSRALSPSLLSDMFTRQASSSCSASSHATPLTPATSSACGKPILRRPTQSNSASTSASEDGGFRSANAGYGFSSTTCSEDQRPYGALSRKKSTLTFAVKCPTALVTSDSGHSPVSSFCRPFPSNRAKLFSKSPACDSSQWLQKDLDDDEEDENVEEDEDEDEEYDFTRHSSPLQEEASESDDEGYEEDEEGGFTDDEDLVGTFTAPSSRSPWVPSSRWSRDHQPSPRFTSSPRRATDSMADSAYTSDEGHNDGPVGMANRGRKVSIALESCIERCSRHRSPPPKTRSLSPGHAAPFCPPAARSPSAMEMCRKRESSKEVFTGKVGGWKSDDCGLFGPGDRKASLPVSSVVAPTRSILVRSSTPSSPTQASAELLGESALDQPSGPLHRRDSAPARSTAKRPVCFRP